MWTRPAEGAPVIREGAADDVFPLACIPMLHAMSTADTGMWRPVSQSGSGLENSFKTEATHQGYIEPHACLGSLGNDGKGELWCTTQGHWYAQKMCAALLGLETSQLRVTASEIGGGFGGKTTVFIEPVALLCLAKLTNPLGIMSRSEVFRATGPTASTSMDIKIGMKKDGTITVASGVFRLQGSAFPGAPCEFTAMCAFAPYALENVHQIGYDVMSNRPKQAAYRAPGSPMAALQCRSVIDDLPKTGA